MDLSRRDCRLSRVPAPIRDRQTSTRLLDLDRSLPVELRSAGRRPDVCSWLLCSTQRVAFHTPEGAADYCSLRRPELAEAVTKGPGEMRRGRWHSSHIREQGFCSRFGSGNRGDARGSRPRERGGAARKLASRFRGPLRAVPGPRYLTGYGADWGVHCGVVKGRMRSRVWPGCGRSYAKVCVGRQVRRRRRVAWCVGCRRVVAGVVDRWSRVG